MLIALLACTDGNVTLENGSEPAEPVDVTVSDEDLGTLDANQFVLTGAEIVLDPGTDLMTCVYGTYTGPDVGLHDVHTYQGLYGHHFTLNGTTTPAIDAPDGTVVDCTSESASYQMASLEPLGLPNHATVDGVLLETALPLPDGMAVELESGQRYILQSHYINSGPDPIRVTDRVVLTTVPTEEVEIWVAPLVFNRDDFRIPAGGTLTTSFRCTAENDWNLLYMMGHMHEWGTSFRVDTVEGETRTPFYAVPEWDPVFRDAPVVLSAEDDLVTIPAGTTFETTCSWANDTEADLVFPHEMCDAVSFVWPQKATVICDGNGQ